MSLYKVIVDNSPTGIAAKKLAYQGVASQIFNMLNKHYDEQEIASLATSLMNYDWTAMGALTYLNPTPGLRREHSKLCDKLSELTAEVYALMKKIDKPGFDANAANQKLAQAQNRKALLARGRTR